jgi:hypothetical protein
MACIKCNLNFNKDDEVLNCDGCQRKLHKECSELTASELRVLDLKSKRTLKFFCDDCQEGTKLLYKIPELIAKIDAMQHEIASLKQNPPHFSEEAIIHEIGERQIKANNVMVYNLPESPDKQDIDSVNLLISEICGVNLVVSKTVRLGKKNKNGNRPLKIVFRNADDALSMIRNRKNIDKKKKIFVEIDMTAVQMNNMKRLRDEVKVRRDNGEDVFIKFVRGVPQIVSKN